MRVTEQMQANMIRLSLQSSVDELGRSNRQLMTGKKADKPSDDVLGTVQAMDYRVSISANERFRNNIDLADIELSFTSATMESVSSSLANLYSLVSLGSQPLVDPDLRASYSQQAAEWRDMLLNLSNTKYGDKYIFSGYQTGLPAFAANPAVPALPLQYDYNGDSGKTNVPVARGMNVPVNLPGSTVFSPPLPLNPPALLPDGRSVAYAQVTNPANGINTLTVTVGAVGDPDYDTFAASNYMEMANILSFAWKGQAVDGTPLGPDAATSQTMGMHRVQALAPVFEGVSSQMIQITTDIGLRKTRLDDQVKRLSNTYLSLKTALSRVEDADINQVAVDIKTAQVALEAMRTTAAQILSQSIFDFLS